MDVKHHVYFYSEVHAASVQRFKAPISIAATEHQLAANAVGGCKIVMEESMR